ncbi:MAG: hypothetical protein R3307_08555 [Anaerolineales bacterium]|nr:hypothetical protein [Anaerolineales bacterium]
MNKSDWKDIAELLGIAAIFGSLVFVGMELRQSQQIAIAGQYQQRAEAFVDQLYNRLAYSSEQERLAELVRTSYTDFVDPSLLESLSNEAIAVTWTRASADGTMFDNNYFQYQSGIMSEDGWQAMRGRLKGGLRTDPFFRAEMSLRASRYRESFLDLCDQLLEEIELEKE